MTTVIASDGEAKLPKDYDIEMDEPEKRYSSEVLVDCSGLGGGSVEEFVGGLISKHPLLVISKKSCPFCL